MIKVEVKEEKVLEVEERVHTKVEKQSLHAQVEDATLKIQFKIQFIIKHKVRGMINLKFNVITARNMGIMQVNVERNNMILVN